MSLIKGAKGISGIVLHICKITRAIFKKKGKAPLFIILNRHVIPLLFLSKKGAKIPSLHTVLSAHTKYNHLIVTTGAEIKECFFFFIHLVITSRCAADGAAALIF